MIRSFLTVSLGTLASRLLGFGRDAMMAALLGAGPVADAFLFAFQLINVSRRLLTEGALNAALIPAWLRIRTAEGAADAAAFAGQVLGTLSLVLVVAAALLGAAMPLVVAMLAPGFVGHQTLQLAVADIRLMLPYLAFAGPVAVLMGLQNAHGRFALTAFSPVLFNVALVAVMAGLLLGRYDALTAAQVMAGTVGAAGLLQLAILLFRRGDVSASPVRAALNPAMRDFLRKAIPGMVASAGPQLLVVGGAIVASGSPAAVSWLYFANRLIELPLGIVSSAMGAVLLPEQARAIGGADRGASIAAQSRGVELAFGLGLPAAIGLAVLSQPIVRLLFERGAFGPADTAATAMALVLLSLGLPAHMLMKALSPSFFAREDTRTPLLATLAGFAVAVGAALLIPAQFGVSGIAAAIALAAWVSAGILWARSAAASSLTLDRAARRRLPRIGMAALAMGALLWPARGWLPMAGSHSLAQAAGLALLITGGLVIYAGLLVLTDVIRPADLKAIRRSRVH